MEAEVQNWQIICCDCEGIKLGKASGTSEYDALNKFCHENFSHPLHKRKAILVEAESDSKPSGKVMRHKGKPGIGK